MASAATASSERTTRTARTRKPISGVQPKTESAHRLQRQTGELGPQLSDEEVQGAGPADHRGAPHLEHQLFSADRFALARGQRGQDLELGLGQRLRVSVQRDLMAFAVDGDRTRE